MTNDFIITIDEIFPNGDKIVIEPMEHQGEQQTKSGIIIATDSNSATPTLGKILRAGPDSIYKVGENVFFRRYSLDEIEVNMSIGKRKVYFISSKEDTLGEYRPEIKNPKK